MLFRIGGIAGAILLTVLALPASAADRPLANGAIERPAPSNPFAGAKPVPLRPSAEFIATLNAIVESQLAIQDEAAAAGTHKPPRPRPDRDHLFRPARLGG